MLEQAVIRPPFSSAARSSVMPVGEPRIQQTLAVYPEPRDARRRGTSTAARVTSAARSPPGTGCGVSPSTGLRSTIGRPLGLVDEFVDRRMAGHVGGIYRDLRRVVAGEPGGVDHDAAHDARHAEADDRRVAGVGGCARGAAGSPSRRTPGPCARRSPAGISAGAGLIRFSFSANSSSLAHTTAPPARRAARSGKLENANGRWCGLMLARCSLATSLGPTACVLPVVVATLGSEHALQARPLILASSLRTTLRSVSTSLCMRSAIVPNTSGVPVGHRRT